jgi:hypothetical protein
MSDIAQLASVGTFVALSAAIGVALWESYKQTRLTNRRTPRRRGYP